MQHAIQAGSLAAPSAPAVDVEALTWRDIEALPYYVAGIVILVTFVMGLAEAGPNLQLGAAKAMLLVTLLGVRHAFLNEGAA
jgi:hypothetical protein